MDAIEMIIKTLSDKGTRNTWLAKRIGISQSHLSNILGGRRELSQKISEDIQRVLNIKFDAPRFQIIINNGGKSRTFKYFDWADCGKTAQEMAEQVATDWLKKKRSIWLPILAPFKPPKILDVVEYDINTKSAKRGGLKFKLDYITTNAHTLLATKFSESYRYIEID